MQEIAAHTTHAMLNAASVRHPVPQLPDVCGGALVTCFPPLAALLLSEQVQVCISRSTRLNIAAQGGKSKLKETETSKVELILIYLLWRG